MFSRSSILKLIPGHFYRVQTQPLIDHYAAGGNLYHVDGVGSMDEVYRRIVEGMK